MSELLNPKDFIITRKRKKYRFALFTNSPLCFELDAWQKTSTVDVVEVGAGNAHFLVELATRYPDQQYVAIDVKADRLQSGARLASERNLTNIQFVRARADQIDTMFTEGTIKTLWLTFSDPYPRKRSSGRRMTHPVYLRRYAKILLPGGDLIIKHDNPAFFQWSLEQLIAEKWSITDLSFSLHDSELPSDYKILTAYEQRWLGEGRITQLVRASQ